MQNSTDIAERAEALYETRVETNSPSTTETETSVALPTGPTEDIREVKVRRVQRFFRQTVLESYNNRCAISGLAIPELLVASHIIPWAEDESRRADPTNGIALNALYDKAFDRGLITIDENYRLLISNSLKGDKITDVVKRYFIELEGQKINLPYRFLPNREWCAHHYRTIFRLDKYINS